MGVVATFVLRVELQIVAPSSFVIPPLSNSLSLSMNEFHTLTHVSPRSRSTIQHFMSGDGRERTGARAVMVSQWHRMNGSGSMSREIPTVNIGVRVTRMGRTTVDI